MRVSVCVGVLAVCCWGLGIIFYHQMLAWKIPAILAAGAFMLLGACLTTMCLACCMVELGEALKHERPETL